MFTHPFFFLSLIFLAALFEAIGDISFKFSYLRGGPVYLWIGAVLYVVATIIWAFSLRYGYLSKAISIVTIMNCMIVVLVGLFIFKEDV